MPFVIFVALPGNSTSRALNKTNNRDGLPASRLSFLMTMLTRIKDEITFIFL